ncbi:MAG: hypothetical protein ACYC1D_01285 [Acidimicrobiales bacterium]
MMGSLVSPVVDTPAARDFMAEIVARLDRSDLSAMTEQLAAKSARMSALLAREEIDRVSGDDLRRILRSCFPSRRRADAILNDIGPAPLGALIGDLVWSGDPLEERIARFDHALVGFPEVMVDLPWELLHLVDPERYWLWTRWMWNPRTETGSLRLVTVDEVDLSADGRVPAYRRVGEALAMVHQTARAVDFVDEGPFGIDVYLACVYGIYMYTVLRMRMSQEFNRIVPELPSLARRLLGIYHAEV